MIGNLIDGIMPPWARFVPWVGCLSLVLALWAMVERGGKLSGEIEAAQAEIDRQKEQIDSQKALIGEMERDAEINDAILAERERYVQRTAGRLRFVEDGIRQIMANASADDCINRPIGPALDGMLRQPADPADDEPDPGEPSGPARD